MNSKAVRDRCVFGAIAAFSGVLIGGAIAILLFWEHPQQPFNRGLVLFSGIYFCVAGFVLQARSADLLAGATEVGVRRAEVESGDILSSRPPVQTVPSDTLTGVVGLG